MKILSLLLLTFTANADDTFLIPFRNHFSCVNTDEGAFVKLNNMNKYSVADTFTGYASIQSCEEVRRRIRNSYAHFFDAKIESRTFHHEMYGSYEKVVLGFPRLATLRVVGVNPLP